MICCFVCGLLDTPHLLKQNLSQWSVMKDIFKRIKMALSSHVISGVLIYFSFPEKKKKKKKETQKKGRGILKLLNFTVSTMF